MSLLKYFAKQTSASALHSETDLTNKKRRTVDECVQRAMKEESKKSVAGRYNKYTPEERASIGKYAAENGSTKAARHFSKLLKRDINKSTARKHVNSH